MRAFDTDKIVLASHNRGKLIEMAALLQPWNITLQSAADYNLPEPEETGADYTANAIIKARASAIATGIPALADDSGFEVTALDNAPGIYSARWAETADGGDKDFNMAMQKIHDEMTAKDNNNTGVLDTGVLDTGIPDTSCRFVCALALVWPDGHIETTLGIVAGSFVWPPRGGKGFGYDPVFMPDGHDMTFGEMEPAAKDAMSHRAQAFTELASRCLGKP